VLTRPSVAHWQLNLTGVEIFVGMQLALPDGSMILTTTKGIVAMSLSLALAACPQQLEPIEDTETSTDGSSSGDDGDIVDDIVDDIGGDSSGSDDLGLVVDDESSDSTDTGDTCGDSAVQRDEECDGWNDAFETCKTLGFAGGELGCHDDCTFDTSGCFPAGCGNGIIEFPEVCDGTPYPCWLLGFAGSLEEDGLTGCGDDCMPDPSSCAPACNWGDSGCFCWAATSCPVGEQCDPHPLFPQDAPGTCEPISCRELGEFCTDSGPADLHCCPGLTCVDYVCAF
jgi:hypothetical protein